VKANITIIELFCQAHWARKHSNYSNCNDCNDSKLYTVCKIDELYNEILYQDICYDAFIGYIGVNDENLKASFYSGIKVNDYIILYKYQGAKSNKFIKKYFRCRITGPIIIVRYDGEKFTKDIHKTVCEILNSMDSRQLK